jgi:hypothetical protein
MAWSQGDECYPHDGFKQKVVRFTTDIPYLTNWGQPLLLGPGSIHEGSAR